VPAPAPAASSAEGATKASDSVPLAFPEAIGWAAHTPGGRGGRLLRVTTLKAMGEGSLAAALAASGPRTIVFEVGGVIDLERTTLEIREPFVTIAGQTAPSPGITLIKGGITIRTHDVVMQHLRVRPGEAGQAKLSGWEIDGITTSNGAHDVIVDHCSTSWATDENLSASGSRFSGDTPEEWREATSHRITFSNNIVAEGLSNSTHRKGEHSKGSLIHDNASDVLIASSLYHSNVERNPFFKGGARGVVANNLISNPKAYAIKYTLVEQEWGDRPYQVGQLSVVGNVFVHGPATNPEAPLVYSSGAGPCQLFLSDNVAKAADKQVPLLGGVLKNLLTVDKPPLWPDGFQPLAAAAVQAHVEKNAGARPWDRDATDLRIVREARSGGGKIIDSEREVEGYPVSKETRSAFIPEAWDLASMTPR